jgi:hypothetical protein
MKKWTSIDFLRLDKYIMLVQTVLEKYFEVNFAKQKFENISEIVDYINELRNSGIYNFNFISSIVKPLSNTLERIIYESNINPEKFKKLVNKILNVKFSLILEFY